MTIRVKITNQDDRSNAVVVVKLVSPIGKPIPNEPYRELKGGEWCEFLVYGPRCIQVQELNLNV